MLKNKSSLYRSYRPRTFATVAGHKNIITILQNEVKNNSFPHALLFTGQKGTGKTSLARIFAKAINCENNIDGNPCENCLSCQLNNQGQAPNVFEIDAASNNGVDEIRNIKENVSILPLSGRYKVYIIDEVHMLSKGAFNALLKTLEEPPKHALFVLATTEFAKIPATIISRCQTFNLQKIDQKSLISRLNFVAESEGFILEKRTAQEIYFLSEGSLRDALNYLEQLMIISDHELSLENLQKLFYLAPLSEKLMVIKNLLQGNFKDIIKYFENADAKGLDFHQFVLSLMVILKEILEYFLTNDENLLNYLEKKDLDGWSSEIDDYFAIADCLAEAYEKAKGSGLNFNYLLISLLKLQPHSIKQKVQEPISQITKKITLNDLKNTKITKISECTNPSKLEITNQMALNTLVAPNGQARKEITEILTKCFNHDAQENLMNESEAIKMLAWYEGKIVAVSDCEILIRFDTNWASNYLRECLLDKEYSDQLRDFFGKDYRIYPIDETQFTLLKKEFSFKQKAKILPIHQHEILQKNDNNENETNSEIGFETLVKQTFGEDLDLES